MIALLAAATCFAMPDVDYRTAGTQLLRMIDERFSRGTTLCEWVDVEGAQSKEPAFTWDLAVTLSALAQAMRSDRAKYEPMFDRVFASLVPYGSKVLGGFGYSDLPNLKHSDRYYDDNEWIGIALLEAYEISPKATYLNRAKQIFKWLESAETPDLGGGLFWRENTRREKNTCSNAPGIVMALKLCEATKRSEYRKFAERTNKWMIRLQDKDGLFFDHLTLDGKLEKTKWTYNTALAIRSNLEFFRLTKRAEFLEEAKRIGLASISHWIDSTTGAIKDESPFAHHLADAWLELGEKDPKGPWTAAAKRAIDYAYATTGLSGGLFGERWDRPNDPKAQRKLIHQASMARALWHAAQSKPD